MIKNKKGQQITNVPQKEIYWGFLMSITWAVCILFLMLIIFKYKAAVIYFPPEIEDSILSYRFLYAPGCFAYGDEDSGRVYAGVIDWDKFTTEERMDQCYSVAPEWHTRAFKLVLRREGVDREEGTCEERSDCVQSNNWIDETWQGEAERFVRKPVIIKDGENFVNGELQFFIR